MRNAMILVLALGALASCTERTNYHQFDGVFFRADAKSQRSNRAEFRVEVRQATQTLEGAREAGRYEATQHCLRFFGTSLVDWENGPDDGTDVLEGDTLILTGTCVE
ncbi:hypothetical protein [Pseudaestuariivita sp.]|uniref:hypothetical protein n=1 Tax=Pseudaestuariivita sp. TaxID=2211669 RepID=UPI00405A0114